MKSIEPVKKIGLIGLIKSSKDFPKMHLKHYFSSISIKGPKAKLSICFNYVLNERKPYF